MYYRMTIAGLERDLPICPISDELQIAGFVIFGDPNLTCACAAELLKRAPEYDLLITAESKGIPLAHEMARQHGDDAYILARKSVNLYMHDVISVDVQSITTAKKQTLYLDGDDAALMRGKRILIVDDVIHRRISPYAGSAGRAGRRYRMRPYGHPCRRRRPEPRRHHLSRKAAPLQQGRSAPLSPLISGCGGALRKPGASPYWTYSCRTVRSLRWRYRRPAARAASARTPPSAKMQ